MCFTQKQRKNCGPYNDTAYINPESVFLSKEYVDQIEKDVNETRGEGGGKGKGKQKDTRVQGGVEDGYEPKMRVPTSVLNGCSDSFKVADKK